MKKIQTLFLFLLLFTKLSTVSGAPTLAGVKIFVSYMPYSPNASQIMYLTNEGTSDSKIYVKCFDESGKEYDLGEVGVAKGKSVTKLANNIQTKLQEKGFTAGKLSFQIWVSNPEIDGYFSYNIGGADRGYIQHRREFLLALPTFFPKP